MDRKDNVVAIDPGKKHFGWALFLNGELMNCGTDHNDRPDMLVKMAISRATPRLILTCYGIIPDLVMEKPEDYRGNRKVESLEGLRYLCKMLDKLVGVKKFYFPKEWKAQVPKGVHHKRLVAFLNAAETRVWDKADHNAKDAVGIGLFHLGRTRRGGIEV